MTQVVTIIPSDSVLWSYELGSDISTSDGNDYTKMTRMVTIIPSGSDGNDYTKMTRMVTIIPK
jgi:hypothetical protein